MTAITIKVELIQCVKAFTGIPDNKQAVIDHFLEKINQTPIPNDEKGKQFAGGLLNLLGELIPQVKNDGNKRLVDKLEHRLNQAIAFELVAQSRSPQKR